MFETNQLQDEMCDSIPSYVVPIYHSQHFIGTGFIVGDTLITAHHVGMYQYGLNKFAIVNKKKYTLYPQMAAKYEFIDTYMYRLYDIDYESPLQFANEEPVYFDGNNTPSIYQSMHFQQNEGEPIMFWGTDCYVMNETYEWKERFWGYNKKKTSFGASGSPLIKDNLVYGMLVGGNIYNEQDFDMIAKEMEKNDATPEQIKNISWMNNNAIYVKGCVIRQAYERKFI